MARTATCQPLSSRRGCLGLAHHLRQVVTIYFRKVSVETGAGVSG